VMYNRGVDVVYAAAGGSGSGTIEAAKQAKKFALGVDSNQDYLAPDSMIGSMVKRVDNAVFTTIKDVVDGKFTGGTVVMGLGDEGVGLSGLAPINSDIAIKNAGKANLEKVTQLRKEILDGKIKVEDQMGGK
jgi:basic membrane protein A